MEWCEANGVDYIFGFAGNAVLARHGAADRPTRCVCGARYRARRSCAPGRRCATAPRAGRQQRRIGRPHRGDDARPRHPLRRHLARGNAPSISTRPSIAAAARRRTSSSCTRPSSPPIARRAAIRAPTSLPREAPRLCRGGSRSLTFPAVAHRRKAPTREPPRTRKGVSRWAGTYEPVDFRREQGCFAHLPLPLRSSRVGSRRGIGGAKVLCWEPHIHPGRFERPHF